jgi:hypothetical protein
MEQDNRDIIPEQKTGAKTDVISTEEFASLEEAKVFFQQCKQRLLDINRWTELGGADFKLADQQGNEVGRTVPEVGDHFKIDIPGPGTLTGEGYDWVKIESIEDKTGASEEEELVAIRVRPAGNPNNEKTDVAHFFTDEATSSFIVQRRGTTVSAEVHGRNEKPNTAAEAVIDKTRNTMVAAGAMVGFSEVQWKSLVKGLLGK